MTDPLVPFTRDQLARAIAKASDGDTIRIASGTYESVIPSSVDEVADALVDAFVAGTFVGENDAQTYDQTRHAVYELVGKIQQDAEAQRDRLRAALDHAMDGLRDILTISPDEYAQDRASDAMARAALTDDPLPLGPVKYPAKPGAANVSLVDDDQEGET